MRYTTIDGDEKMMNIFYKTIKYSCICEPSVKMSKTQFLNIEDLLIRDGSSHQIRLIFGKIPNDLGPAPPHFRKITLQIFMTDMVAFIRGGIMAR